MIVNRTKNMILAREVETADNHGKRAKGLMFRESLPGGHALLMVFPKKGNHKIWMFGMRFPLDVIFLDSGRRVIAIHENVKPLNFDPRTWKTYCPEGKAKYVIELNPHTAKRTKTECGDLLEF